MTVHFIGAGPGDPDLITVRGRRLIEACPVVLYAGSLVPSEVIAFAPEGARVIDTAPMTLDKIVAEMQAAHTGRGTTSPGCTRAIPPSTERSGSRCAASTRSRSPTT